MPKNKAKGRRRAGGQARGAEKGEQRQIRVAAARQHETVDSIVSGVVIRDQASVCIFRDEWKACGHDILRWPARWRASRNGVTELCLGSSRVGNIDDISDAIVTLPDEIGDLESLTKLYLNGCSSIKSLPDSILDLEALTELILNDCASLTALPSEIGVLDTLTRLDLSGCSSLTELPDSIHLLSSLTHLNLSGCSGLIALRHFISGATALTHLDLSNCSSLTRLPVTIAELTSLTELDLSRSGLITINEVPEAPGLPPLLPPSLRILDLSGCASLVALPVKIDAIDNLSVHGADDVPRYDGDARIWTRIMNRWCDGCGRQFALDAPRLRHCGRCFEPRYCGVECQRADWENHEIDCRRIRKETRRRCVVCGLKADDSDHPFPSCHCGKRYYCGEACQTEDWVNGTACSWPHSETCASGYLHLAPRSPSTGAVGELNAALLNDVEDEILDSLTPPKTPPQTPPQTPPPRPPPKSPPVALEGYYSGY